MRIYCMTGGVEEILRSDVRDGLLVVSSSNPPIINMVEELAGTSSDFRRVAVQSRSNSLVIIMLFAAKIYKNVYLSAIVFDKGRIIGVSDMTHRVSGEMLLDKGQSYRIYDCSVGRVGVVVGDDIFFPEVARSEVLASARVLLHISPFRSDNMTRLALAANSLFNGVNTIYLLSDECGIVGLYGNIIENSTDFCAEFDLEPQYDDKLIRSRRAEIYQDVFINDQV